MYLLSQPDWNNSWFVRTYCDFISGASLQLNFNRAWTLQTALTIALFSQHSFSKVHFVSELPLYNSITDRFLSLFCNVELRSLKSIYQLNHEVNIGCRLT